MTENGVTEVVCIFVGGHMCLLKDVFICDVRLINNETNKLSKDIYKGRHIEPFGHKNVLLKKMVDHLTWPLNENALQHSCNRAFFGVRPFIKAFVLSDPLGIGCENIHSSSKH